MSRREVVSMRDPQKLSGQATWVAIPREPRVLRDILARYLLASRDQVLSSVGLPFSILRVPLLFFSLLGQST